jgi:hypothetical protein
MLIKHTPGPWEARRLISNNGEPYATSYFAHIDIGVCMVWAPTGNIEQEANAHLIAAAPDMYEALAQAAEILRDVAKTSGLTHSDAESCADTAESVLAKARGES